MQKFLMILLLIVSTPIYAIEGFKPPAQLIDPLVDELLADIKSLLLLDTPKERPVILLTTREQIVEAYCDKNKPCNVAAVTDGDNGIIYLDAKMEFNNIYNVSILYHELVHFVQIKNKVFYDLRDCKQWARAEMHAYTAQSNWLSYHGARGFKVPDLLKQCN